MAKVVYTSLKPSKLGKKAVSVTTKRVRNSLGEAMTVYTVDADSRTFSEDLSYAFRQNVKKVRREHKRRLGAAERVVAKA